MTMRDDILTHRPEHRFDLVNDAYAEQDNTARVNDRAAKLMASELLELNEKLRRESDLRARASEALLKTVLDNAAEAIISLKGEKERFVFQGVHMLFDGRPDCPWGANPRRNQLIFIGRNLDRAALNKGFTQCLA